MTKIALVGERSTVFAKNLLGDVLAKPSLANAHIALHDISVGDRWKAAESAWGGVTAGAERPRS